MLFNLFFLSLCLGGVLFRCIEKVVIDGVCYCFGFINGYKLVFVVKYFRCFINWCIKVDVVMKGGFCNDVGKIFGEV